MELFKNLQWDCKLKSRLLGLCNCLAMGVEEDLGQMLIFILTV